MNKYLLSTAFWPSIGYCSRLIQGKILIDQEEHFVKQSIRSRCEIMGPNGKQQLIVPLQKWKDKTLTSGIKISYNDRWQKLHWKSLEAAYRSSPYFEFYEDKLRGVYEDQREYLVELNQKILQLIQELLNVSINVEYSKEYVELVEDYEDLRGNSHQLEKPDKYNQVFSDRHDFIPNLSFLDLICNEGPNAITYLK